VSRSKDRRFANLLPKTLSTSLLFRLMPHKTGQNRERVAQEAGRQRRHCV